MDPFKTTPLYGTLLDQDFPQELAFPKETYAARLEATRAAMSREGLDALVVVHNPNQAYLTGYDSHMTPSYAVTVVPAEGSMILHCAELETPPALLHSVVRDIRIFDWTKAKTTAGDLADVLRDIGVERGRIGIELRNDENFTMGAYDASSFLTLRRELPEAELVDATHIILDQRVIKSSEELDHMRRAGEIGWAGITAAIEATYPGCSENEIVSGAYSGAAKAGSELMSIDPMLMTGRHTGFVPHLPYRRRKVDNGDVVYLEMTGTYWRYNAPTMRSWVIGEASQRQERLAAAAIEVLETLIEGARPGRTGHDVAAEAARKWEQVPGTNFHGGYGYAVGLAVQPSWCEQAVYIAEGADRELEPGMTFHLPILSSDPGELGLGFSETIAITETGSEVISSGLNRKLLTV